MIKIFENLNDFHIVKSIGFGCFGTVFKGIEINKHIPVALKFIFLSDGKITKEINREILLLSILDSKFFPELYGYIETKYYLKWNIYN